MSDPQLTRMAFSNHLIIQNRGLLKIALVLNQADWVASALDGPRGFAAILTGAVVDDGLCYESSTGYHHHKDRLSLQVFAGKRLWTVDAMCESTTSHGFSAPVQQPFNRTMLAHNVVVVDQQNQQEGASALPVILFRELPGCTTISMSDHAGSLYSGVRMRRHVAVTKEYCLDVFEVIGEEPHTFDWLIHPRGDSRVESGQTWQIGHLSDQGPYTILTEIQRAEIPPAGADLVWSQAGDRMHLSVSTGESGSIWRCRYPLTDRGEGQGEFFMVRSQGSRAIFTALYRMQAGDRCWRVASSRRDWNGEWHEIRVSLEGKGETRELVFRGLG